MYYVVSYRQTSSIAGSIPMSLFLRGFLMEEIQKKTIVWRGRDSIFLNTWSVQVQNVCLRVQQRLCFLRRLRVFGVNQEVLLLFYRAVIERYGISAWFGNLSVHLKAQITRLTQRDMKITGVKQHPTLQALFEETVTRQAQQIISDPTRVLHSEYKLLPSGRRFRAHKCRLNPFKNPFVPCPLKH